MKQLGFDILLEPGEDKPDEVALRLAQENLSREIAKRGLVPVRGTDRIVTGKHRAWRRDVWCNEP